MSLLLITPLVVSTSCETGERTVRSRVSQGGFSVLVDSDGHPGAARVMADIGAAAQAHGFTRGAARSGPPIDPVTREPLPKPTERYARGVLELEVSYQPSTHRVSAYFHNSQTSHDVGAIHKFFMEYHRAYAPGYGAPDPISETAFSDGSPTYDDGPQVPHFRPDSQG